MIKHHTTVFSGSYDKKDCIFLLKVLGKASTTSFDDIATKEKYIQDGQRHYSEMLSLECIPSASYLTVFYQAVEKHGLRLAQHVVQLADLICQARQESITLVSLARAGTPIGVLLQRRLRALGRDSVHYSISIIRDRGIDQNALRFLFEQAGRSPSSVVFVDGWTAKGTITRELKRAIAGWNASFPTQRLSDQLFVISDIGRVADVCATHSDYLIPSGILNAIVSGLVSRSILDNRIGNNDFHGCIYYDTFLSDDRSIWFVDSISALMITAVVSPTSSTALLPITNISNNRLQGFQAMVVVLWDLMREYNVSDINRIKPGIAEATRAMLRRVPDVLLLADIDDPDVAHLLLLARTKGVAVIACDHLIFRAATIIKDVTVLAS